MTRYRITGVISSKVEPEKFDRILRRSASVNSLIVLDTEIVEEFVPHQHFFYVEVEGTSEDVTRFQDEVTTLFTL